MHLRYDDFLHTRPVFNQKIIQDRVQRQEGVSQAQISAQNLAKIPAQLSFITRQRILKAIVRKHLITTGSHGSARQLHREALQGNLATERQCSKVEGSVSISCEVGPVIV